MIITLTTGETITFDQASIDGAAQALHYQANIDDGTGTGNTIPNPQTTEQFLYAAILNFVGSNNALTVIQGLQPAQDAINQAIQAANATINTAIPAIGTLVSQPPKI